MPRKFFVVDGIRWVRKISNSPSSGSTQNAVLAAPVELASEPCPCDADLIRRALAQAGGDRTRAAQLLRMPLRTFMKRLGEYEVE